MNAFDIVNCLLHNHPVHRASLLFVCATLSCSVFSTEVTHDEMEVAPKIQSQADAGYYYTNPLDYNCNTPLPEHALYYIPTGVVYPHGNRARMMYDGHTYMCNGGTGKWVGVMSDYHSMCGFARAGQPIVCAGSRSAVSCPKSSTMREAVINGVTFRTCQMK